MYCKTQKTRSMKTKVFLITMLFMVVSGIDVCQAQELWRVEGCIAGSVWIEDERHPGLYWCVDTTRVNVQVELSEVPEDIGWTIDSYGKAQVPVPDGVRIEDFVASLKTFSWVKHIGFYHGVGAIVCKKYLQTISEGKEWPLVRMGGKAWIEDYAYENYYWEVDTTRVQVHVYDLSEVPEDITWNFSKWGFASVPVPEDVMIEDFMAFIRAYPWVESVEYNTWGVLASMDEIVGIKGVEASDAEKVNDKSPDGKYFDLTGRPLMSPPTQGIYIQNGKKCWVK